MPGVAVFARWLSNRDSRVEIALIGLLVIGSTLVFSKDLTVGGMRYSDASIHAMDGVLLHDWVLAGPDAWGEPFEFALQQYAHYPALGIGRHYPPGFAVVESVFFYLFGISAETARACVAFFGVLAVIGCYRFVRLFSTRTVAFCGAVFLFSIPGIVYWTRMVMLEMPTLCVLIWAAWAAVRYWQKPGWGRWVVFVLLASASLAFKQAAVFILPVLVLPGVVGVFRRRFPWKQVAATVVALGVVSVGFVMVNITLGGGEEETTCLTRLVTEGNWLTRWLNAENLLFYPVSWPRWIGWPVLILAGVGGLLSLRHLRREWALPAVWFVVFCGMMLALSNVKQTRYFFFGYFPVAIWAGLAVGWIVNRIPRRAVATAVCGVVVVVATWSGYRVKTFVEPDYRPFVRANVDKIRGSMFLYEGFRDVDFVFAVRSVLGPRDTVIIRGSKVFYSCATHPQFGGMNEYVQSAGDVEQVIEQLGFETIMVERQNRLGSAVVDLVRESIEGSEKLERVDSFCLYDFDPMPANAMDVIDVYRVRDPRPREVSLLEIPIPIDDRTVVVDLDELGVGSSG